MYACLSGYSLSQLLRWSVEYEWSHLASIAQNELNQWQVEYRFKEKGRKRVVVTDALHIVKQLRSASHMNPSDLPTCWNPNCKRHPMVATDERHGACVMMICPECRARILWPRRSVRANQKRFKFDNAGNKTHRWHNGRQEWLKIRRRQNEHN